MSGWVGACLSQGTEIAACIGIGLLEFPSLTPPPSPHRAFQALEDMGYATAGQAQTLSLPELTSRFGDRLGSYVWHAARGLDTSEGAMTIACHLRLCAYHPVL